MAQAKVCEKFYIDADGNESSHAGPDTVELQFRFTNETVLSVTRETIGAGCQVAALFHGIAQKGGDSYAGVKGDVSIAVENCETVLERLAGDDWIKPGEGAGTKPSMVHEAVIAALEKASPGEEIEVDRSDAIRERLKDADERKKALANPAIAVEYERIKSERQAERARRAAEALENADEEKTDLSAY